ncbi:C3HC zinc finger-like-domain-containing protein [Cantharellus anzutake]|uniref:C3HC zinc finger-like-domain-containing protein n=1 Tax=Cantharellus anzutake TaxID=1750568 RepID=UPI00190837E3|nr:C3HC zinc finger-like-domain-containing protein [Cantharellus anzutake]KAF8339592.1 C3HC zinc finger-like-domain-containing protein [Cantharellus anzutake]
MSTTTTEAPRITKRKLDDAISILDSAVNESKTDIGGVDPSPSKRPATAKSIYASLSKYGFRGKDKAPEKQGPSRTPKLTSLLNRTRSPQLERSSSHPGSTQPSTHPHISLPQALTSRPPYRPTSTPDFLNRLSTFKLSTYRDKPRPINAVAAAKCGWKNDGQNRLVCENCNAAWVVGQTTGMSRDAANALIERQKASMVTGHKESCPWRKRQCDDRAIILSPAVQSISIKHPLNTSQLTSLLTTINSLPSAQDILSIASEQIPPPLSDTALILSLFGWGPTSSSHLPGHRQSSLTQSLSRATSASLGRTPSLARGSNTPRFALERSPTPVGSPSPTVSMIRLPGSKFDVTLSCSLCQRRIGLWSFQPTPAVDAPDVTAPTAINGLRNGTNETSADSPSPSSPASARPSLNPHPRRPTQLRTLDVTTEHRSFCPYIVKSTPMPSYPAFTGAGDGSNVNPRPKSKQSDAELLVEGWRAVLGVVNRAGMGARRRRSDVFGPLSSTDDQMADEGAANVDSMVESVKKGGTRDLLRYVKGLLG